MPDDEEEMEEGGGPRSFWSGTLAFGLVSLQVSLLVAHRPRRMSLRMLDQDGTPLVRRYFCSREDKPIANEETVRGVELGPEQFIVVEDQELEALAPEKSREIDLSRFVPLSSIDPIYFERAYYLVPQEGATKAYRLLARAMAETQRAGIASFVMRDKEYLVAIIAEGGLLRAETLRFHDELRAPADVGLPQLEPAKQAAVKRMEAQIAALSSDKLDRGALSDEATRRLMALVERKLTAGQDVVRLPEPAQTEPGAEIIDLMEVLKQSLKSPPEAPAPPPEARGEPPRGQLPKRTKGELYERARELDIPGRSNMTREQLERAIEEAS